jgi:Na+-driven multidrug efflux pump
MRKSRNVTSFLCKKMLKSLVMIKSLWFVLIIHLKLLEGFPKVKIARSTPWYGRDSFFHSGSEYSEHVTKNLNHRLTLKQSIDREFLNISVPAFIGLLTEPMISIMEGVYVARLGSASQGAIGVANNAQYSIAKIYNDPLLKTTTSIVAGKSGIELSAAVSSALIGAVWIGLLQSLVYLFFAIPLLGALGVTPASDMYLPALWNLRFRALGVPAGTVLIVANGIFRGRADTRTPLYIFTMGSLLNLLLDPLFMFVFKLGLLGTSMLIYTYPDTSVSL